LVAESTLHSSEQVLVSSETSANNYEHSTHRRINSTNPNDDDNDVDDDVVEDSETIFPNTLKHRIVSIQQPVDESSKKRRYNNLKR
jgi:hypothetical protein